jgi:hypothetical protein
MAKHAAGVCKNPHIPQMGAPGVDVRKGLFQVSHHTTLAHTNLTFAIDGLSVSGFTFGAHLANIYYNSDQRSGRFCNDMFGNPDLIALAEHINAYWDLSSVTSSTPRCASSRKVSSSMECTSTRALSS